MSLATTRLAAPCSAAWLKREREKVRKQERKRGREEERDRENPVQLKHSKSRWLVPTVSWAVHASQLA